MNVDCLFPFMKEFHAVQYASFLSVKFNHKALPFHFISGYVYIIAARKNETINTCFTWTDVTDSTDWTNLTEGGKNRTPLSKMFFWGIEIVSPGVGLGVKSEI